jgi:N-methylhydantoinase A
MVEATAEAHQKLERTYQEMERSARATLRNEGFSNSQQRHERSLAVRYKGQSFELELKWIKGDLSNSFHRLHRARYGYAQESNMVQIVGVRLRSSGLLDQLREKRLPAASDQGFFEPSKYETVHIAGRRVRAGVYRREDLGAGAKLKLPCIVIEYSATTLIPAGARATMDRYGNLIINAQP